MWLFHISLLTAVVHFEVDHSIASVLPTCSLYDALLMKESHKAYLISYANNLYLVMLLLIQSQEMSFTGEIDSKAHHTVFIAYPLS